MQKRERFVHGTSKINQTWKVQFLCQNLVSKHSLSYCASVGHVTFCYKLIQRFMVTCLFIGQYTTGYYGTITINKTDLNQIKLSAYFLVGVKSEEIEIPVNCLKKLSHF